MNFHSLYYLYVSKAHAHKQQCDRCNIFIEMILNEFAFSRGNMLKLHYDVLAAREPKPCDSEGCFSTALAMADRLRESMRQLRESADDLMARSRASQPGGPEMKMTRGHDPVDLLASGGGDSGTRKRGRHSHGRRGSSGYVSCSYLVVVVFRILILAGPST